MSHQPYYRSDNDVYQVILFEYLTQIHEYGYSELMGTQRITLLYPHFVLPITKKYIMACSGEKASIHPSLQEP